MAFVVNNDEIITVNYHNEVIHKVIKDHEIIFERRRKSALEWLEDGYTDDGVYTIYPDGVNPIDVYCDMTTDGGGWTLVSFAGNINTSKSNETGQSDAYWEPLLFSWGNVETDSISSKKSFSRFDIIKSIAKPGDEIRAKRTSNNYTLIFPITNLNWFGRQPSEGHFNITDSNNNIPYLKLNNGSGLKTVTDNVKWCYVNDNSSHYPGINWNVPDDENCDKCGRSYETALNHRSLLYWESNDGSYSADQWFHASPMSLTDSTSADNAVQDIGFWFREV